MLNALLQSGKFTVTAIKRPSSSAVYPATVQVREADLSSLDSVTAAFKGQDAVVSTVGSAGLPGQGILVAAAAAANVKRFIPSDFGCDLANPKAAALPVFKAKIATHATLREAAAARPDGTFTYTLVCNGAFLDWGLEKSFLVDWKGGKPKLADGGEKRFSATTLDSVGQAVVGILTHPAETKNRFVYVKDIDVSQKQLLAIAKKVAGPDKTWEEPILLDTAEMEKSSYESLAKGQVTQAVMYNFLFRVIYGPDEYGGRFERTDNELLGIKGKTEADVEAILASSMRGSK